MVHHEPRAGFIKIPTTRLGKIRSDAWSAERCCIFGKLKYRQLGISVPGESTHHKLANSSKELITAKESVKVPHTVRMMKSSIVRAESGPACCFEHDTRPKR